MTLISLDNTIFAGYAFYAAVLALKLIFMSPLTGFLRIKTKTFTNPEDASKFKTKVKIDPSVERVRRAHLNDLENIPAFWFLGFLYVATNPSASCALMCFRLFTAARIGHTIMYLSGISLLRGIFFALGLLVNIFMGIKIVLYLL